MSSPQEFKSCKAGRKPGDFWSEVRFEGKPSARFMGDFLVIADSGDLTRRFGG